MLLTELTLATSYSTDSSHIIKEFYVPCMQRSILYRRAVGYFTSSGLSVAAQAITHLLTNGGKIRLVASPYLNDDDIEAIKRGYAEKEKVLLDITRKNFADIKDTLVRDRLNALAWLIASGQLEIRLALRVDPSGNLKRGIFHEKMGIFSDINDNSVAFSGSPNETESGLIENYEAIDVFWSWEDPQKRVTSKVERFEKFWNNKTPGLQVIDFTSAGAELLMAYKREERPVLDPSEKIPIFIDSGKAHGVPSIPPEIFLRDYQWEALKNWFSNNGRGTFKMATGSGKTILALAIAVNLFEKIGLQAVVIVCPFRHLVTQWAEESQKFGFEPILAFERRVSWEGLLDNALFNVSQGNRPIVSVITTNATFSSTEFQRKLQYFPQKTFFVADEVHNLGAQNLRQCLPSDVRFRLALSATPERWFDDTGTDKLFEYFGPLLEPQLTIKDAIANKALVPYRYFPLLIELSDEERDQYLTLSEKIARMIHGDREENDGQEDSILTALLVKRSRLLATAVGKVEALRDLMADKKGASHMLFYCGDGTIEDPSTEEEMRQIDSICRLLGNEMGIRVSPYTAETSVEEREVLKRRLDRGELQGLVAIRCLDEGIDIPSVRMAVILASSRNPKQFIQRRGRVLRPSPEKDFAEIYDMIVMPPKDVAVIETERILLRKELKRLAEFADLALNSGEARLKVLDLQRKYDLMDI